MLQPLYVTQVGSPNESPSVLPFVMYRFAWVTRSINDVVWLLVLLSLLFLGCIDHSSDSSSVSIPGILSHNKSSFFVCERLLKSPHSIISNLSDDSSRRELISSNGS